MAVFINVEEDKISNVFTDRICIKASNVDTNFNWFSLSYVY